MTVTSSRLDGPTSLYRLFDEEKQLLYVGVAGNPGRRFEQHRSEKTWWGAVKSVSLEHFSTRAAAFDAEAAAIRDEKPLHNIAGVKGMTERFREVLKVSGERSNRIQVAEAPLMPGSLVGSFFHSDAARAWQGCVVAQISPSPTIYLVELFEWITGTSTEQVLVELEDMLRSGWTFYDSSDWAVDHYMTEVKHVWEAERSEVSRNGSSPESKLTEADRSAFDGATFTLNSPEHPEAPRP